MVKNVLVILITILGVNVMAQSDLHRGHHKGEGLYFSFSGGLGYFSMSDRITDAGSTTIRNKGGAGEVNISLGTAIKDNLVVFGDILANVTGDIHMSTSGDATGIISGADNLYMRIYGGGASYYFMPSNFFVSGTLGLGTFEAETNDEGDPTVPGIGLSLRAGKDWWVSKSCDMGISCKLSYVRVDTQTNQRTEVLSGVSLAASFKITLH